MEIDHQKTAILFKCTPEEYFLCWNTTLNEYSLNYRIDRSEKGKDDDIGIPRIMLDEEEYKELKKYFIEVLTI